jgi:hypothetical protein
MALSFALHSIESNPDVGLTVYGEYLEGHPPTHEVQIHQSSAWSCSHGVGRWKENCGCNSGGHGAWNQLWRAPLRHALDELRDKLAPIYETEAGRILKDPWKARDEYIAVILNRSPENIARFFAEHAIRELTESEQTTALELLEMQRHAMLMYTSCGWFFDEISGIETVQVIQYAARAIQLASALTDEPLEANFLTNLEQAQSNLPENGNGRQIYERFVKPAVMTPEKVAAHYAISSLFESYPEEAPIYSFIVRQEDRQIFTAGQTRLAIGRARVTFAVTRVSEVMTYVVLHMGEHNLNCGVRAASDTGNYPEMVKEMREAFEQADFPELIRLADRHFGNTHYSLKNLFRDQQRNVLNQILTATRNEIHNTYRLLTDRFATLTRFLTDMQAPQLSVLAPAIEFVINSELRKQFENGSLDVERVKSLLAEGQTNKIDLDRPNLAFAVKGYLDRLSHEWNGKREEVDLVQRLLNAASLIHSLPVEINLWTPQNTYYGIATALQSEMASRTDDKARVWREKFEALGKELGFRSNLQPVAP